MNSSRVSLHFLSCQRIVWKGCIRFFRTKGFSSSHHISATSCATKENNDNSNDNRMLSVWMLKNVDVQLKVKIFLAFLINRRFAAKKLTEINGKLMLWQRFEVTNNWEARKTSETSQIFQQIAKKLARNIYVNLDSVSSDKRIFAARWCRRDFDVAHNET